MKAVYVSPEKTPLTFEQASKAIGAALESSLGERARPEVLALALAKTALETGRWSSIYCDNFGNIKAGAEYVGMFTCITLNEVLKGEGTVWFAPEGRLTRKGGEVTGTRYSVPDGHPQTRMRAYANAFDGAHSYVEFVEHGRYLDAWNELLTGNAHDYVMALHAKGYFTADPEVYARSVMSLHREFLGRLSGAAHVIEANVPDCDEVHCMLSPQAWNVAAVRSLGQQWATESTFVNLETLRLEAHREMLADDDDHRGAQ